MGDLEDRERLRYLQLKEKAAMGGDVAPPSDPPLMQNLMGKMLGPDRAKTVYDTMSIPMQMSKQGLEGMAQELTPSPETTGRPAIDVVRNYPAISARTLSKVAPSFISPESMATAAIAPAIGLAGKGVRAVARPAGRWAGAQMEDLAGMVPGSLKEAFNNAGAMLAKGKKAAQPFYESGKVVSQEGKSVNPSAVFDENGILSAVPDKKIKKLSDTIKNSLDHKEVVQAADELADMKNLHPADALKARKSIDQMIKKKSAPLDTLFAKRSKMDAIVKSSPDLATGDALHQKGMMAESLRSLFPKTQGGKASSWKTMMAILSGKAPIFSPVALGSASTGAGLVGRKLLSPLIDAPSSPAMTAVSLLRSKRGKE